MVLPIFLKVQGFHQARESFGRVQSYSGMIDCFKVIAKEEGAAGFFKGLAPSTLKVSFLIPWIFLGQYLGSCNHKLENLSRGKGWEYAT